MNSSAGNILTVKDIQESLQRFTVTDYIVFVVMLVTCSSVGLYYAFQGKTKGGDEATEYLMGGRNMKVFPVSMSLIASFVSGITLLGTPTELYLHGTEYLFIMVSFTLTGVLASFFVIPVFHDLQLSSTYEYLHLRFNNKVRIFGSVLFTIRLVCWLPIVIYVPALAFNQVTGVNIYVVTPCVCLVCIFYTCIGGVKAVVWTDVIQMFIMMGSVVVVFIKGTMDAGGIGAVWAANWETGRIEVPSFNPDPTLRHTMFTIFLGGTIHMMQTGIVNQNQIQRYLTLPSLKSARRALWIFVFGTNFFVLTCGFCGLVAFATYKNCDPLTTGLAKAKDQILPLFVMEVMGDYPGMPGLFVSGIFSAALSSLSTGLNSMSAVVLEDFVKPNIGRSLSDTATRWILRSVVIIFGAVCVTLVFVVEKLGAVLQLSMSLSAITSGASFGLFVGGMLLPRLNSKGVLTGGVLGMMASSVIIFGAQKAVAKGAVYHPNKPLSTEGCNYAFKVVSGVHNTTAESDIFPLFRISYLYYTAIGAFVTVLVSLLVSTATGGSDHVNMDPRLFSPIIRKRITRKTQKKDLPEENHLLGVIQK